jgi:hypothetical protein
MEEWMKEPYGEGSAVHPGPESCVGIREDVREGRREGTHLEEKK